MAPPTIPAAERFASKYTVDEETGCWLWTASCMPNGYPQFRAGATSYAHRYAYEQAKGPIPDGAHVDHLCRVRRCVNPDHLEAVVPKENVRRTLPRRSANGEKTHCKRGHPLSGDNLYILPSTGGRGCRACRKEFQREYQREYARKMRADARAWRAEHPPSPEA